MFTITIGVDDWNALGVSPATGRQIDFSLYSPILDGRITTVRTWSVMLDVDGNGSTEAPTIEAGNALRILPRVAGFGEYIYVADPGVPTISLVDLIQGWQVDKTTLAPLPGGQDAWDVFLTQVRDAAGSSDEAIAEAVQTYLTANPPAAGEPLLQTHIDSPTPHPAYDVDLQDLSTLFENGIV